MLSGVDARPSSEVSLGRRNTGNAVREVEVRAVNNKGLSLPKPEIPVTTVKGTKSTVQM